MVGDIDSQKRALRTQLRSRRDAMTAQDREQSTLGLTEQLQRLVAETGARSLSCFLSTPNEPNVRPFVNWAEANGIRVLFPITRPDGLLDWTVGEDELEVAGLFGMPEPSGQLLGPIAVNDVDLMLIPAAAVDVTGMRLGWGRGYYDKTIGSMEAAPPVYAVIFDHELLDALPYDARDQPVSGAVTPERTVNFPPPPHTKPVKVR